MNTNLKIALAGVISMSTGVHAESSEAQIPWLVPHVDYRGDLLKRTALTGGWGGLRQQLMDNGLRFDVNLTQTLQGNAAGGKKEEFTYQGRANFGLRLDTGHAGLWPGGMLVIRGETRYGQDNNLNTGALYPVNTDALFPVPGRNETALSDLYFVQFLSEWLGVTVGKMSPRETNVFAHDETAQFLNTAFNFQLAPATTVPLGFLAAGVTLLPTEWLMINTMALDSEGSTTTSGFDTVFDGGTTVLQSWEATIKPFGLPGHQRVGWTWSDKTKTPFQQDPKVILDAILTSGALELATVNTDYSFFYDFDQYVYLEPGTTDQGLGVFGRVGVGDENVNPIGPYFSLGIGGKGLIPGRENDTFGAGFYFATLSDKLPQVIKSRTQDEYGGELYYNIAVTPWLHATPDIQIIRPVNTDVDTTVVLGGRFKIDF